MVMTGGLLSNVTVIGLLVPELPAASVSVIVIVFKPSDKVFDCVLVTVALPGSAKV